MKPDPSAPAMTQEQPSIRSEVETVVDELLQLDLADQLLNRLFHNGLQFLGESGKIPQVPRDISEEEKGFLQGIIRISVLAVLVEEGTPVKKITRDYLIGLRLLAFADEKNPLLPELRKKLKQQQG